MTAVLRAMNRPYTRAGYLELIRYARRVMPDLVLTSDIIIGFPGETEAEAMDTVSLINEVHFDALFTFIFSPARHARRKAGRSHAARGKAEVVRRALQRPERHQRGKARRLHRQDRARAGRGRERRRGLAALRAHRGQPPRAHEGRQESYRNVHHSKISGSNTWALYGAAEETI